MSRAGRNDPCPCGSGKKFKRCCLGKTAGASREASAPREAARLKTWRPKLVDLLKEMENHQARAAREGRPAYDFGWLWKELGIERP